MEMVRDFYVPREPLDQYVEHFWHFEIYHSPCQRAKILPTGTFELVFNLLENEIRIYNPNDNSCSRFAGAVISGPYSRCLVSDAKEDTSIMGVHFKPGGAFPFFGKADQFLNSHVDLDACLGVSTRYLRERLIEAKTALSRFEILEEFLLNCISGFDGHHYAVKFALKKFEDHGPQVKIRDIYEEIGISERRFITVFASEIGMNPKTLSRILRFQNAMILINNNLGFGLTDIAAQAGYFDQSHLIKDFLQFSNISPMDYAVSRARLLDQGVYLKANHLPHD